MYLDSTKKEEIFAKHGKSNTDTSSLVADSIVFIPYFAFDSASEVKQKDYNTERSLRILVGKRRRLLDYLIEEDIERYRAIIKELGIRK